MPLNIDDPEIERLLDEVVRLTGESRSEALRNALEERRQRLVLQAATPRSEARLRAFLEDEIWPQVPIDVLGTTLTKDEEAAILGFSEAGIGPSTPRPS